MRRKRKKISVRKLMRMGFVAVLVAMVVTVGIGVVQKLWVKEEQDVATQGYPESEIKLPPKEETDEILGLAEVADLPEELRELLAKNPDTKEFVLNYSLKKNQNFDIDLTEYENSDSVPLFFQWDERWGYTQYGSNVMGLTGCGPTCLSMVCVFLLKDATYTPRYVADFAEENGYCVSGSGSAWTLISEGGEILGLDVTEIPLDENRIMKNLKQGNPIICIMGPGDFTATGHFIVLTGCEDGKFKVNDPNSKINSEQLWAYEDIKGQIKNLWVCKKIQN